MFNTKDEMYAFFWVIPGVWILHTDVSEHCVCSIFIGGQVWTYPPVYEGGIDRVFRNVSI